jgi:hypothetical protein
MRSNVRILIKYPLKKLISILYFFNIIYSNYGIVFIIPLTENNLARLDLPDYFVGKKIYGKI